MIDLTDDERGEAVAALYERKFETQRYVRDAQSMLDQHAKHGENCCGRGQDAVWQSHLDGFKARLAAVDGALEKLGETL